MLLLALAGCSSYDGDSRFSGIWRLEDYEGSGQTSNIRFDGANYRITGSRDPEHPLVEFMSNRGVTGRDVGGQLMMDNTITITFDFDPNTEWRFIREGNVAPAS